MFDDSEKLLIKGLLEKRLVELFSKVLGEPNKRLSNARTMRWGNKGSIALALSGSKFGQWVDRESGKGGDAFRLIEIYDGCNFSGAMGYARRFLGLPDAGKAQKVNPAQASKLQKEREARQAERDAATAKDDAKRIKAARLIWVGAGPIAGTLGEKYLVETRGIVSASWPSSIRWSAKERAIAVCVTDDTGQVVAVQMIAVGPDAKKDAARWPKKGGAKTSIGLISGGWVRCPGVAAGPVMLAEGVETGLSAWLASGFETWIKCGSLVGCAPPVGKRRVLVLREDHAPADNLYKSLKGQAEAWVKAGVNLAEVWPFEARRFDKSDLNDTLRECGLDAVRRRVMLAAGDDAIILRSTVPLALAREKLAGCIGTRFFQYIRDNPLKRPVHGIQSDVGTGKTDAVLDCAAAHVALMRMARCKKVGVISCPTHALTLAGKERFEKTEAAKHYGLRAEVWRGRRADRPGQPGVKMCANLDEVREANRVLADIEQEVCQKCVHRKGCPYLAQKELRADVWFVSHEVIFGNPPKAIKGNPDDGEGVGFLIVDENPWQSGLIGCGDHPIEVALDALDSGVMPGCHELVALRSMLKALLLRQDDGPISLSELRGAGLTADMVRKASEWEWNRKIKKGPWPDRAANKTIRAMSALWKSLFEVLTHEHERSGWLALGRTRENDGVRVIKVTGRKKVEGDWFVPTLLLDANLDAEILRNFWPYLKVTGKFQVDTPHMKVFQFEDRSFGKRMLEPRKLPHDSDEAAQDDRYRAKNRRAVKASVMKLDSGKGGDLVVISNKSIVERLGLPGHVGLSWFNGLRGLNHWEWVRNLVVVGKPQPRPAAVERMAGALTGSAPQSLNGAWYPKTDAARLQRRGAGVVHVAGETSRHPDATCGPRPNSRVTSRQIAQSIGSRASMSSSKRP